MLTAKVLKKDAQRVKKYLIAHDLFDDRYSLVADTKYVYFPVVKKFKLTGITFVEKKSNSSRREPTTLKEMLKGKLTQKELTLLKTSFDSVGTIAIMEIPDELATKEKLIGESLLKLNPSLTTVVKKVGIHGGEFRTQKVKIIAGKRSKETLYKENGARITFNVETVYFSMRLATERKRIYQRVKKDERILVMFGGCGVYSVVFAKNTNAKEMISVEKNPVGHMYATQNITLNKVGDRVSAHEGDVREIVPKLRGTFDRIIMPLPKDAELFLDVALKKCKKGTKIHMYGFVQEDEVDDLKKRVREICSENNKKIRIREVVLCGQYAPRKYRVCVDFSVL